MSTQSTFVTRTYIVLAFTLFLGGWLTLADSSAGSPSVPQYKGTIVLLHGLGRSRSALWQLSRRLKTAGYRVERIGYRSLHDPIQTILEDVSEQVAECCLETTQPLHFVGHSLGGLIVRAYLAQRRPENLGRVVLLGTPNRGAQLVDRYRERWWFKLLGPAAQSLGTGNNSLAKSLPKPDYPVGVIAGVSNRWSNERYLPGQDDGLVTVKSAKFAGMSDFKLMHVRHSAMRNDKVVAGQILHFLEHGHFQKTKTRSTKQQWADSAPDHHPSN